MHQEMIPNKASFYLKFRSNDRF